MIEAGGTWKRDGDGEILELKGGQSLTGRLCTLDVADGMGQAVNTDRVHFQVGIVRARRRHQLGHNDST